MLAGGATVFSDTQQAEKLLGDFLSDREKFASQRKACADFVQSHAGATQKIVREILAELDGLIKH